MNTKFGLVSLLKLSVQKYINEELIIRVMHAVRLGCIKVSILNIKAYYMLHISYILFYINIFFLI